MSEQAHRPCELCAVRALKGERSELSTGLTFVAPEALELLRIGPEETADTLLASAVRSLGLDFAFVPSSAPSAEAAVEAVLDTGAAPLWVVDGPFANAVGVHGWTEALRLTTADPERLGTALDAGAARALAEVLRGLAAGAAGIVVADDLAGARGPLMAPDFVFDEVLPRVAPLVLEARRVDLPSVFHSDGDARVFLAMIARAGFSAVHVGGIGEDGFVRMLRSARDQGLRVVGGIEGEALRAGPSAAARAGVQAALFAAAGDLLVSDDGAITTADEFSAFARAIEAVRGNEAE